MWVHETYVNETQGYSFGDSDWYESWTDDIGKLFRSMQKEYGRCISKVFRDRPYRFDHPDGEIQIGWAFMKTMTYEDARPPYKERDYYVRTVWVELSMTQPHRVSTIDNVTSPFIGKK